DVIDDIVGVLLQGIVDARFEIGLRTVVIDAEAAADVHVLEAARAGPPQLRVEPRRFRYRGFDLANVSDLAAQMEVQQLEAIRHVPGAQFLEGAHYFRGGQAELRTVAPGRLPATGAAARQLGPD